MRSREGYPVKPGAEQMPQGGLAVMHAVAILDDSHRICIRSGHESTGAQHQSKRESRTRNRPPCQMTSHRRVLTGESAYSSVEKIAALKPDCDWQGFLPPSCKIQDSRGKHEGLASCRCVVRQNLYLIGHVVRQPPERRDPEKRGRKKSKDSHAERVLVSDVSRFVGED